MDTVIKTALDRETLDAFVDGALPPEAAARVVMHLADCPGDQAYVDAVMETNALLGAAFAEPLHQALPERLRVTIFPAGASAAPRAAARTDRRANPMRPGRAAWGALAASAALAFGLAMGVTSGRDAGPTMAGLSVADDDLRAALEASPSGVISETAGGAEISVIASFLGGDGRPCRQFEVLDAESDALTQGLACRDDAGRWISEIAVASRVAAPEAREVGFMTASGAGDDALIAALDRLGAGMSLTPDDEQALLRSGWAH